MSYESNGYSYVRKIIANADKASLNGNGNKVKSIFGTINMYKSNVRGRFYSVSKSTIPNVLPNGGSYKIGTLRSRLMTLDNFQFS